MFLLFLENRKSTQNLFSGTKKKNVTLQILNFIPVSQLIKKSLCGVKGFFFLHPVFIAVKTDSKLKLHHMENFFYYLTYRVKI